MLDDLKLIHERDAYAALSVAEKQWQQLTQEFALPETCNPERVHNVVLAGMGDSALYGLMAQDWPGFHKPFELVRDYDVPAYVGQNTLFFAASCSGNTEETLSALAAAEARNAQIVVITSGGKLADIARAKNYPLLLIPSGYQPRYTVWFGVKAVLTVCDTCGLTNGAAAELAEQSEWLKEVTSAWVPTVPTSQNQAKQIAQELISKSIVLYGGPKMFPAAYKWKINCNENAKHIAWCGRLPEFTRNEFLGWTKQPTRKPYAVVDLRSNLEHPRVQQQFAVASRLLSGMRPHPIVVEPDGSSLLRQLLWVSVLGDFVSLYLAFLNGVDPIEHNLADNLEKTLIQHT